jgi:hypothetical protein
MMQLEYVEEKVVLLQNFRYLTQYYQMPLFWACASLKATPGDEKFQHSPHLEAAHLS